MKLVGFILGEQFSTVGALPGGAGDLTDQRADPGARGIALAVGVAAVFDQIVEGVEQPVPFLIRDEMGLLWQVIRAVVNRPAAVALDFHVLGVVLFWGGVDLLLRFDNSITCFLRKWKWVFLPSPF